VGPIGADFEGVAFYMGRAGGAGANFDGTTREELIIREGINPRNNIWSDILLGYQVLDVAREPLF